MNRCRALLAAVALAGALSAPRVAEADRRTDLARLAPPLRALLARFLLVVPERAVPEASAPLGDEYESEALDRARASRRAERAEQGAGSAISAAAGAGARRESAPSSP